MRRAASAIGLYSASSDCPCARLHFLRCAICVECYSACNNRRLCSAMTSLRASRAKINCRLAAAPIMVRARNVCEERERGEYK